MFDTTTTRRRPARLPGLSMELGLPRDWLKAEALAGRIPCLKIGRHLLFNVEAVRAELDRRAAMSRADEPTPAA